MASPFRESYCLAIERTLETVWAADHARRFAAMLRECSTARFVCFVMVVTAYSVGHRAWETLKWLGLVLIGRAPPTVGLILPAPMFWRTRHFFWLLRGWSRRLPCYVGIHQKVPMLALMPPKFDREVLVCGGCLRALKKYELDAEKYRLILKAQTHRMLELLRRADEENRTPRQ